MNDRAQPRLDLEPALARYREAPESKLFAPLAAAHRDNGRPEEAVRILQAGLQRHPRYVSALVLLAQCHLDLQQEAEAEAAFSHVLEQDAENLIALRYRAELARRRGALERAVELLRRALEIDPFDRDVQADLGLATTALERRVRESAVPPPVLPEPLPPPAVAPSWSFDAPRPETPAWPEPPARTPPAPAPAPPAWSFETPARATPEPPPAPPAWSFETPARAAPELPPAPAKDEPAWHPAPEPPSPWLEPPIAPTPLTVDPFAPAASNFEPPPVPWQPAARAPESVEPPRIDLRQVGSADPGWLRTPEPAPPAAPETPPSDRSSWTFTRDDDRIIVAPDAPVRGPIRSVEDRLWSERRPPSRPREAPPEPPMSPPAAATPAPAPAPEPAVPGSEFATLTLARIYESQGYYQKALGIYDELLRRHPQDAEVAARRAALQRRLAGIDDASPAPAPPASDAQPPLAWRLLDPASLESESPAEAAERLRQTTQAARDLERSRRHLVVGPPPAPPPPTPPAPAAPVEPPLREDLSRGHPDFERFLAYVRSLRREA